MYQDCDLIIEGPPMRSFVSNFFETNWELITSHPIVFVVTLLIGLSFGWFIASKFYKRQIDIQKDTIENLKSATPAEKKGKAPTTRLKASDGAKQGIKLTDLRKLPDA